MERVTRIEGVYGDWLQAWEDGLFTRESTRPLPSEAMTRRRLDWLFELELDAMSDEDMALLARCDEPTTDMVWALQRARARERSEASWEEFYAAHPEVDIRPALARLDEARGGMAHALAALQAFTARTSAQYARLEEAREMFDDLGTAVTLASLIGCVNPGNLLSTGVGIFVDQLDIRASLAVASASDIAEGYAMRRNQIDCLLGDAGTMDACMETASMTQQEMIQRTAALAGEVQRWWEQWVTARASVDEVFQVRQLFVLTHITVGESADVSWPPALSTDAARQQWPRGR